MKGQRAGFMRKGKQLLLRPSTSDGAQPSSSGQAQPAGSNGAGASAAGGGGAGGGGGCRVLVYGGYSGEAVEGDVLQLDPKTLEIELVRRGPSESDKGGTVPAVRFAHSAAVVPAPDAPTGYVVIVFGGVNPAEDLNDVAVWM
ncbi:hypothetical protein HYH03_000230 [Edaphochlamys debaryana]|uniref:Uncharacterized protein n=1 Tax=Edaphochlamys debaryana TaxID=47281 RepID=A0A836C6B1_9CHLO|nr:hypothetical protein HYH03_000230 [Edaphochlamys debaryana]|eukprot:KAG2501730.1 hypothetical protein HYH03_000230 [Edaphochlamys debaryana]